MTSPSSSAHRSNPSASEPNAPRSAVNNFAVQRHSTEKAHSLQGVLLYLKQYLRAPTQIGAVAPSSDQLAERMLETIDFTKAKVISEFGPGPGGVTAVLLRKLQPQTTFFAIEANPQMCVAFRKRFPSITLFEGSAAEVGTFAATAGQPKEGCLDAIVSGLPWAAFTAELQHSILTAAVKALRPGGQFVTFAYSAGVYLPAGKRFAAALPRYFSSITRSRGVWLNIPPAFVYRCVK